MSEPIEITNLEQLEDIIVAVTLPLLDGREALVKIKPLSAGEMRAIRASVKRGKPPIKDYQKIGGEAMPVYDYQDQAYRDAEEAADQELSSKMLVASLVMNIPGETTEEKCKAVETRLGRASFVYLIQAVNKINIPGAEDIEQVMLSFRRLGDGRTSDHDQSGAYPVRVEKLVESRTLRDDGIPASARRKNRSTAE